MKINIIYYDDDDQVFCFQHAVELISKGATKINSKISEDEGDCILCSGEIEERDIFPDWLKK